MKFALVTFGVLVVVVTLFLLLSTPAGAVLHGDMTNMVGIDIDI
jgi:hypothetical protein